MTPQEQLDYERQIAQVIAIRQGPASGESKAYRWLNSPVCLALLGIAGTAVLGSWISGLVQDRSKRNEMELQARMELVKARHEAVASILQLLGAFVSSSDDLLATVNTAYSESGRPANEVAALRKWRETTAAARDKADSDWRQQRGGWGFKLVYLFGDNATVNSAWSVLVKRADDFENCSRSWYTQHAMAGSELKAEAICAAERKALDNATADLTRAVAIR